MQNRFLLLFFVAFLMGALYVEAQYNGFQLEQQKPPSLLPQPGPGEMAILMELRQMNRLLEQNNQILQEQNRMLKDFLAQAQADRTARRK